MNIYSRSQMEVNQKHLKSTKTALTLHSGT